MNAHHFSVERVDVISAQSFAETVAAFEKKVPAADLAALNRLANGHASRREVEASVQAMVGDLGFMILGKIDQGPLVSLLGKPKKLSVYLIGNPVLANRMFEQNPAVGVYAPLRVSIYEDYEGKAHFTYEKPSSSLAQFDHAEIHAVAKMLDDKMNQLTAHIAGE